MNRRRLVVLVIALLLASSAGIISVRHAHEQSTALEACGATETGDWTTALRLTDAVTPDSTTGRIAVECRCSALLATGSAEACESLLDRALAAPGAETWAPNPPLSVHLVQSRRSQGRSREAAALARRAAARYPDDGDLFYLELVTRVGVEDEDAVLREMFSRIDPRARDATRMRVSVATRHLIRGDPRRALDALGAGPPHGERAAIERWYDTRGMALANAGDLDGVRRNYAAWQQAGGHPAELQARYALTLSIAGLADPEHGSVGLLERALREADGQADDALLEAVAIRLILTLIDADRHDQALEIFDRYYGRFEMVGLSREELERSAEHRGLETAAAGLRAAVRFEIETPVEAGALWVSPPPDAPLDDLYAAHRVSETGVVDLERRPDTAPVRWVYRDARDRVLASGTTHLVGGAEKSVAITPREPRAMQQATLSRRPGDGRRRVVLVLLDCADWRIVQYLRTRGELPVFDALLDSGHRAVLDSNPPLTAAALEALVWPGRRTDASVVGLVHQLGVELAGLASVGENPFDALSWVLPEDTDLFATIGAGDRVAANLLFSHGGIRAGRHSELTGPKGLRRRLPVATSERDLDADERARWPGLTHHRGESDAVHLRTIAAEFDTAEQIVRDGVIDFLALRIESLDILTHAHFATTVASGQDDGDRFLFELYRYIDARLGATHALLDEDDVFIAMSDHGIRTAMEHSRHAMFVATGRDVPRGRSAGRPALRGVSAVVAELLDVESGVPADWPVTGIAPWASTVRPARTPAALPDPGHEADRS